MIPSFLEPTMILLKGENHYVARLSREKHGFYALQYHGDMTKRGLVLAEDQEILERLGIEVVPHWKYKDSPHIKAAYGVHCLVHPQEQHIKIKVDPKVEGFLTYSNNEDYANLLNDEDAFGNG